MLMAAAVKRTDTGLCKGINIIIDGVNENSFIEKKDIEAMLMPYLGGRIKQKVMSNIDLHSMERAIERDIWVSNAEIYFDNNRVLQVEVNERKPIARIFTITGESFYIDSMCKLLPLSDRISVQVPVFTNFPGDPAMLTKKDQKWLKDIKVLSEAVYHDTFLMAITDQIDLVSKNKFELYPKLGNFVVQFGDISDCEQKFTKLKLFYKNVLPKAGWNRYNKINLMYDNQVVARVRSEEDVISDSLKTMELMKKISSYMERMADDTTFHIADKMEAEVQDLSIVLNSIQRDEEDEPVLKSDNALPVATVGSNPTVKKVAENKENEQRVKVETRKPETKLKTAHEVKKKSPPKTVMKAKAPAKTPTKKIKNDY